MDCAVVGELVAAYLDDELSPGERVQLEEHLGQCETCRALVDGLATQDLGPPLELRGLDSESMWLSMDQRLAEAWEREAALRGQAPPLMARRLSVRAPAALAYAALLLLSLAWGWGNHRRAVQAELVAETMSQQLDREQRLAAEPADPPPSDGFSLVSYTPHRGTF